MKLNYISKKATSIVLGTVVLVTPIMLTGCSNYYTNENGEVELIKNISYSTLCECEIIALKTKGEVKLFITEIHSSRHDGDCYHDILTDQEVYSKSDDENYEEIELISEEKVMPYLLVYDLIKDSYTKEDIEGLIKNIKEDYYDFLIEKIKVYE